MKTAVEWFVEKLIHNGDEERYFSAEEVEMLIKKAKQMEKEQIVEAWDDAYEKGTRDRIEKISNPVGNAEQYYNETFKSE